MFHARPRCARGSSRSAAECARTTIARARVSSPSSSDCSSPSAGCSRIACPPIRRILGAVAQRANESLLRTRKQWPHRCRRHANRGRDLTVRHIVRAHHEQCRVPLGQQSERLPNQLRLLGPAHRGVSTGSRISSITCSPALGAHDREMSRTSDLTALRIACEISRDDVQPRVGRARRLVDEPHERFLREILREVAIAEPPVEIPDETRIVAFEQRANVQSGLCCLEQRESMQRRDMQ